MTTKLEKVIRREIEIEGERYTVAISPQGLKLTKKRFRSGMALSWKALWSGNVKPPESGISSADASRGTGVPLK
jgi:hypothetical protein